MTQPAKDSAIYDAVELLKDNGFDALSGAVTVLLNTAVADQRSEYLGGRPYQRQEDRRGYRHPSGGINNVAGPANTQEIAGTGRRQALLQSACETACWPHLFTHCRGEIVTFRTVPGLQLV
jgi:hypothetical protein